MRRVIQDGSNQESAILMNLFLCVDGIFNSRASGANHHYHSVGEPGHDTGFRNPGRGRGVYQDHVEMAA